MTTEATNPTLGEIIERAEFRERIGVGIMHATKCTHDGDDFGDGAVCVTCFDNTQRIGAIVERELQRWKREAGK